MTVSLRSRAFYAGDEDLPSELPAWVIRMAAYVRGRKRRHHCGRPHLWRRRVLGRRHHLMRRTPSSNGILTQVGKCGAMIAVLLASSSDGNQTFDNQGRSRQTYGNQTFGSDGTTYQRYGNQTFDNHGNPWQRYGNQTFGSNGTSCQRIGNQVFCN